MKEKLTKFSRGVFQFENQPLMFSKNSIEVGIEAGKIHQGSFTISTRTRIPIKGVLSKTDHFLKLSETSFSGTEITVPYAYDATQLTAGVTRTGSIKVISNCGEYEIPFTIKIEVPYFVTEHGMIRDLFQFANLAKQDWLCAVKLFKSEQFAEKLLCHDTKNEVLYRSLVKSISTSHGMEEFLISIHKKLRINLTLDKTNIQYSNVVESLEDRVVICKDNWGYIKIQVRTDAPFIALERKIIWSENFIGNTYSLKFLVNKENLKPGLNRGFIYLTTPHQNFCVEIIAHGQTNSDSHEMKRRKWISKQECLVTLTQNYLNFRMNRIALDDYLLEMHNLLNQLYDAGEEEIYYFLRTHLAVSEENAEEIKECFSYLEEKQEQWKQGDMVCYAAYEYFIAMKDRDAKRIEEAYEVIQSLYQMEPGNWKLFWFLLHVKKEYMDNPKMRFEALQDMLKCGVSSSIIYYEASVLYREYPEFLSEVSEEAIPVMSWMIRENCMTKEVRQQYLLMVSKRKKFYPILYHSLEKLYEEQEDIEVLQVILSMLVRTQKAGKQYFKWYELGVIRQVRILQLYEYYMYSIEEDISRILPESLLTYFSFDCTLSEKKKAFLYANIIQNWEQYDNKLIKGYEEVIHEFAKKELEKRVMNKHLAILYEELCTSNAFDETVKANLPYVMFQQELRCENDDIVGVVVVHQEVCKEDFIPIEDGIAQVSVYTDTAQLFLVDRNNNRYASTIEYYLTKYVSMNELARECLSYAEQNGGLLLYLYEQMETYQNYAEAMVTLCKRLLLFDELRPSFYWKCFVKLATHYYETAQTALLDALLEKVDFPYLENEERLRIMELCMARGNLVDLDQELNAYGYERIATKRLLAYCCRKLSKNPEMEISNVFVEICYHTLKKGRIAKQTTEVLCKHFIGTLDQLIQIWKAAKEYAIDCKDLEEQIVSQSLFSETLRPETIMVFYDYNRRDDKDKLVVRAFLSYRAYLYLLKEVPVEVPLKEEMKKFVNGNNCCIVQLAVLKVLSKQEILSEQELEYSEIWVHQFVAQNISMPFFLGFKKHFQLPFEIANKYFIEYHCNANCKVTVHYALGSEHYKEEPMKNCYQGLFLKPLILFHGDKLSYYIVETGADYEKRTEVTTILYEDDMTEQDSEYSLLNALLIAKEMQDSTTALELMKRYTCVKSIVSEQFKMLK